jgi:LysR family transcriptional regulator, cyn operon transcriptional activator
MELRQLRYFLAVATHGNFTRAAEFSHVSQPSLSVQILSLEEELGSPLFNRMGRHVELTPAGLLLQEHAQRVLRDLEQAREDIRELIGAERGRLMIGAVSTVNTYLIPPVVSRFRQQHPNVHLQVQAQPSLDIENRLLSNQLDVGLCLLPLAQDRLTATKLLDETLCLVGPAQSHVPLRTTKLRMRDLNDFPLVLMPVDYCLRKMIEAECAQAGVHPHVSIEMTSPEGILEAVTQGSGWTILPELYVQHRIKQYSLRMLKLYDPIPRHGVGFTYLPQRHLGTAAQSFLTDCQAVIHALRT